MKTFRWLTATSLAFAAVPVIAAPAAQFSAERLSKHVQILGSDAYEGRGPATRAETKTVDYITREFQAAGL